MENTYYQNHREERLAYAAMYRRAKGQPVRASGDSLPKGVRRSLKKAKSRRPENFELSCDWARSVYVPTCAATGIPFGQEPWNRVSIDRIDSAEGYTRKNSRFVLWIYNVIKGRKTEQEAQARWSQVKDKYTRGPF